MATMTRCGSRKAQAPLHHFLVLLVLLTNCGMATSAPEEDRGKQSVPKTGSKSINQELLQKKLKSGKANFPLPISQYANPKTQNRLILLPTTPLFGTAPANEPSTFGNTFDLERNQYVVEVPHNANALSFRVQGRTKGGDIDLAIRYSLPVDIVDSKLICDYRDDSAANDFIEWTITANLDPKPLQPGPWYIAVGNGAALPADFSLSVGFAVAGVSADEVTLQVDDGSFDRVVGYPAGSTSAYFLNRLTPPSYPASLRSILIYFGNQENGLPVKQSIRVLAGPNPSGSSNIDGITLNHYNSQVAFLDGFNRFDFPAPVTISSGDFVVGFEVGNAREQYPAYQDTGTPSQLRSYTSCDGVHFTVVDRIGTELSGNLAIRAVLTLGAQGTGDTTASLYYPSVLDPAVIPPSQKQAGKEDAISRAAEKYPSRNEKRIALTNAMQTNFVSNGTSSVQNTDSKRPNLLAPRFYPSGVLPASNPQTTEIIPGRGYGWHTNPVEAMADDIRIPKRTRTNFGIKQTTAKATGSKSIPKGASPQATKPQIQLGLCLAALGGAIVRIARHVNWWK